MRRQKDSQLFRDIIYKCSNWPFHFEVKYNLFYFLWSLIFLLQLLFNIINLTAESIQKNDAHLNIMSGHYFRFVAVSAL